MNRIHYLIPALLLTISAAPSRAQSEIKPLQVLGHMVPSPVRPVVPSANPIHSAIKINQAIFMPFLSTGSLRIAEACTLPGPNGIGPAALWIETEHSSLTLRETEDLIIFCHASGLVPIVRVNKNDGNLFKQILEMGALGVVVPQIHSAQDAESAVKACLYPPEGNRSAGVGRASGYHTKFWEYKKDANGLMSVILMIETKDAINNIDAICKQLRPNKDVLWFGLFDLAQSMGVAIDSPEEKAAVESVEKTAKQYGIALGGNCSSLEQANEMYLRGYRLFTYGDPPETAVANGAKAFFSH